MNLGAAPKAYDQSNENQLRRTIERLLLAGGTAGSIAPTTPIISSTDVLNVRDFGAVGDGSTDDADAIQAAFDYIYDNPAQGIQTVYIPPVQNWFLMDHPVVMPRAGTRMLGSFQGSTAESFGSGSKMYLTFSGGFVVVADDGQVEPYLVAATLTGTGNGFFMDKSQPPGQYEYFSFRESPTMELDGLTRFTAEMRFTSTPATTDGWLLSSYGRWFDHELTGSNDGCFVWAMTSGLQRVILKTTDGVFDTSFTAGGTEINDEVPHDIAFDYDGAHLRIYRDGVVVKSIVATGDLVQDVGEEVQFGFHFSVQPEVLGLQNNPTGTYESLRLSNVARYAGGYSPTGAVHANDASTLLLMNFDRHIRSVVRAETKDGDYWAWMRSNQSDGTGLGAGTNTYLTTPVGGSIEGVTVRNFNPTDHGFGAYLDSGGGIAIGAGSYGFNVTRCSIERTRVGVHNGSFGNSYQTKFDHVNVISYAGRFAYQGGHNDGLSTFDSCWFSGGKVVYISWSGAKLFNRCYFQMDNHHGVYGWLGHGRDIVSTPIQMNNCNWDSEGGIPATFKGLLAYNWGGSAPASLVAYGCMFEVNTVGCPFVVCAGDVHMTFDSSVFNFFGSPPTAEIVEVLDGTPFVPVLFRNCLQVGGSVPWSLTADAAVAQEQQAANADTSGATLGQLETEVNQLKAALRAFGVLTP